METTHGQYWGGHVLPYWVFLVVTALPMTGFFGLDHLLFKSPSTALSKCLVNIFTLGLWYFYDIIQAFSDKHYVKHFGLSVPFSGPKGLAFNYFSDIVGDEKNVLDKSTVSVTSILIFTLYIFTLLVPLGLSNFVAGDTVGGTYKLLLSLTPLLGLLMIPIFWGEGLYELYTVITKPNDIFEKGVPRLFPLTLFIDERGFSPNLLNPDALKKALKERSEVPPTNLYTTFVKPILSILGIKDPMEILDTAKCQVVPPIEKTAKAVIVAGEGAAKLAEKVPAIAEGVTNKLTAFTDPAKLKEAALKSAAAQVGGSSVTATTITTGEKTPLDMILLGGIVLLSMGGLGAAVLRKMASVEKNVSTDSPPNPGAV